VEDERTLKRVRAEKITGRSSYSRYELEILAKDGRRVRLDINSFLRRRSDGSMEIIGLGRDVTERSEHFRRELDSSKKRETGLQLLMRGLHQVAEKEDFDAMSQGIFAEARAALGVRTGWIALRQRNGLAVVFLEVEGAVLSGSAIAEGSRASDLYALRRSMVANDLSSTVLVPLPEGMGRVENVLIAPIILNEEAIGLLTVANKSGGFTEEDGEMAFAFAEQMALAQKKARMAEGLQRQAQRICQANAKLDLLNRFTRHDLNNQLMALSMSMELQAAHEGIDVVNLERMRRIIRSVQAQLSFTKDYQEVGVQEPRWQDLDSLFRRAAGQVLQEDLLLECECQGVEIMADPMLEKVMINLLDNSLRHGGGVTRVSFHCEESNGRLQIVYEDDGQGIALGEKERIFELGHGRNTGFGLFLVRQVLDLTDISIHERGLPGTGARFEMLVPAESWRRR
jgi:signal transduction histidine kinase